MPSRQREPFLPLNIMSWGDIESVDAQGLDYTLVLQDGRRLLVNAEENPGLIYEWVDDSWQPSDMVIIDWTLAVQFASLSPLTPKKVIEDLSLSD